VAEARRRFDQSNPIYGCIGIAHWAVYKDEESSPTHPWFVEHRIVQSEADLRRPHDDDEHEYGSFLTWEDAYRTALDWFDAECRDYEDTQPFIKRPTLGRTEQSA
jgi:hypothetical protein